MKRNRIFPTALIVLLGVMQVSQLQAASTYKIGYYGNGGIKNKYQKPTVKICKRAVRSGAHHSTKQGSLTLAIRSWSVKAQTTYGFKASWKIAKNKRQSCGFNKSTNLYRCKVSASPCYPGVYQNSQ